MKIAILGGSYNPPHKGHQLIAKQVLEFAPIDQVWLTPCYLHTFGKTLELTKHRTAMTKMLVGRKIKYCDEEIENKLNGETIELLKLLEKKYPQHKFSFIIGSDNLKDFKKWGQWEELILRFTFWVFPRPKFDYSLKKYSLTNSNYKFKLLKHKNLETSSTSSTQVRQRIQKNQSIDHLVTKRVRKYIESNNLY
ncbi:nicotinate (nicotinamide) nucleotide adenylyltransferase [Patescibacteria group bacterium]